MATEKEKIQLVKITVKNLREAQDKLRLRRAQYNQAISELVHE